MILEVHSVFFPLLGNVTKCCTFSVFFKILTEHINLFFYLNSFSMPVTSETFFCADKLNLYDPCRD